MKILLFVIALFPLSAQAEWFGNYDDCVLDNMKEGMSAAGVFAVKQSCRNKYPMTNDECIKAEKAKGNYDTALIWCYIPIREECMNASYWSKTFGDCKPD